MCTPPEIEKELQQLGMKLQTNLIDLLALEALPWERALKIISPPPAPVQGKNTKRVQLK
jgi:hypothetical protein